MKIELDHSDIVQIIKGYYSTRFAGADIEVDIKAQKNNWDVLVVESSVKINLR